MRLVAGARSIVTPPNALSAGTSSRRARLKRTSIHPACRIAPSSRLTRLREVQTERSGQVDGGGIRTEDRERPDCRRLVLVLSQRAAVETGGSGLIPPGGTSFLADPAAHGDEIVKGLLGSVRSCRARNRGEDGVTTSSDFIGSNRQSASALACAGFCITRAPRYELKGSPNPNAVSSQNLTHAGLVLASFEK
jgi:hypothetical protein